MIPNISRSGSSFRGAGKYHLHDKDETAPKHKKPRTDERVAWTDTRNCAHSDPVKALDEMWATAAMQDALKLQAGVPLTGRKTTNPVKTLSLSWHPSEKVTPEEMAQTADSYLAHLGAAEHQAVYIGHRDTRHPHMHIILNRVHPENGRTLSELHERTRSQEWARQYEQGRGHIFCERRTDPVNDNKRPANGQVPREVVLVWRNAEKSFDAEEGRRAAEIADDWTTLKARQKEERLTYVKEGRKLFREARHAAYVEVRDQFKERWRDYYAEDKQLTKAFKDEQTSAISGILHFLRQGRLDDALNAIKDRDQAGNDRSRQLAEKKDLIREDQKIATRLAQAIACEKLKEEREKPYRELLDRQKAEKRNLRKTHREGGRLDGGIERVEPMAAEAQPAPAQERPGKAYYRRPDRIARPALKTTSERPADDAQRALTSTGSASRAAREVVAEERGSFRAIRWQPRHADRPEPVRGRGLADLGAGAVGSAASYIADQLGELFAPTPPEVREKRAAEDAQRAADLPIVEVKDQDPYARLAEAAVRRVEAEQQTKRDDAAWQQHRDRERDR